MLSNLSPQQILDLGFFLIMLAICVRELVTSILIIFFKKRNKLSFLFYLWPIVLIIKQISIKRYENIMNTYFKRIRLYAFFTFFGVFFVIFGIALNILIILK